MAEMEDLLAAIPEIAQGPKGIKHALYVGASRWRAFLLPELSEWGWKPIILEPWPTNIDYLEHNYDVPIMQGEIVTSPLACRFGLGLWWHGPEHVYRESFPRALANLENHCDLVVLGCPLGEAPQDALDGNPFEWHRWSPQTKDFEDLGYTTVVAPRPGHVPNIIAWKHLENHG